MQYRPSERNKRPISRSARGITLLELAIGMMIISVLSVGVSALVKAGVESQLSQRAHQEMHTVGINIADDLRHDIRTADRARVPNSNTLELFIPNAAGTVSTITYRLSGNNFTRSDTETGSSKTYNSGQTVRLRVLCPSGCFRAGALNNDPVNPSPKQITIPELRVEQILANSGTTIDQHFGTANFRLKDFTFDVMSATEFQ